MAQKRRGNPEKGLRHKRKAQKARGKRVPYPPPPHEPEISEMEGRGKKRMPTMAERSERERAAMQRLRDLNNQEW